MVALLLVLRSQRKHTQERKNIKIKIGTKKNPILFGYIKRNIYLCIVTLKQQNNENN
jgi:hypothetical protein